MTKMRLFDDFQTNRDGKTEEEHVKIKTDLTAIILAGIVTLALYTASALALAAVVEVIV